MDSKEEEEWIAGSSTRTPAAVDENESGESRGTETTAD